MKEKNLTQCKNCLEIKVKIHDGNYDLKNKKFVDEEGSSWNGKICPDCHRNKQKINLRNKRALNAILE